MVKPLTISIPHQLGRTEARRRIEDGFSKSIQLLPGSSIGAYCERWEGDRLSFAVEVMGQSVTGAVDVLDAVVTMEIQLPGILALLAGAMKDRLQKAGRLLLSLK